MGQEGKSAFDWDVYKNRKVALQHLRKNYILVDTVLETEDGSAFEVVHSQVISAFGERLTDYVKQNGQLIEAYKQHGPRASSFYWRTCKWPPKVNVVRLPKVNKYTLNVLVECAYTGYIRTDLPSGGIWQVLEVADYYQMAEVVKACCTFLSKNLNRFNCVHYYHIGVKYRHVLQRCAWHKIRANFKYILLQNQQNQESTQVATPLANRNRQQVIQEQPSAMKQTSTRVSLVALSPNHRSNEIITQRTAIERESSGSSLQLLVSNSQNSNQDLEEIEIKRNNLATISFDHFKTLLSHDKLNIDNEECLWYAIKLWCNYNLTERGHLVGKLLGCMRFPRFRRGTDFSAQFIWRDPLITNSQEAQHELAVLDRNHRDYLNSYALPSYRDGFGLPCSAQPRQLRPRVPHSVLLAIGGWHSGSPTRMIESYDLNCNMWFQQTEKAISMPLAYHGIEFINNLLYICGGTDGSEILNELFTFDPVNGSCRPRASMRESRCYVSTAHLGDYLYAMGGHNGSQRMRSVERFHLTNEIWSHAQDMNVARSDASACVYDSKIFIAGGLNDQSIESSVEFYNPLDNSWTFIQSMQTPRTSFTLLPLGVKLLAIGGNNGSERLSSVEQFDFRTQSWSAHSRMHHQRSTFSAALIEEDKLMVVGGYNGHQPFSQVEMFDARSQQWVVVQRMRADRSGLRVVAVSDLPNANEYTFMGSARGQLTSGQQVAPIHL